MKGSQALLCVPIVVFGAGVLSYILSQRDLERLREERQNNRVVRSLSNLQQEHTKILSRIEKEDVAEVTRLFPWLPKNNTLPNYFMTGVTDTTSYHNLKEVNMAFLHYPRSAGGITIDCLRDISRNHHIAMSPSMTSKNRLLWERGEDNLERFRNRLKIHSGRYVFGVCEKLDSSCSYFLILRDPMQQAISSHNFCKETYDDEICHGFNANRMTLRDWILNQGSVLFHQLMLNIDICSDVVQVNNTISEEFLFNHKNMPCWLKQKLFLDKFSSLSITHAVNYIISHLQEWFAVIGLVGEMSETLEMFEKVYKLPFSKCKHSDKKEDLSSTMYNSAKSVYQRQSDIYDENDPNQLLDDSYVREALSADYRIYKAALKLYHGQKQTLTNKI